MPGKCWLWPGTSPGGALGLQASPGEVHRGGGVWYAVPREQPDCRGLDYPPLPTAGSRCGAETLLNAHAATAQPDLPWSLTSTPPLPTGARRGRCLQIDARGVPCPRRPLAFLPVSRSPGAALSVPSLGQLRRHRLRKPGEGRLDFLSPRLAGFLPAPSSPTQSADTHLQSLKEHGAPTERPRVPSIAPCLLLLGSCQGFAYS